MLPRGNAWRAHAAIAGSQASVNPRRTTALEQFEIRRLRTAPGRLRQAAMSVSPCCQRPLLGTMRSAEALVTATDQLADQASQRRNRTDFSPRDPLRSSVVAKSGHRYHTKADSKNEDCPRRSQGFTNPGPFNQLLRRGWLSELGQSKARISPVARRGAPSEPPMAEG